MERIVVAVDPNVQVSPAQLAAAWNRDREASAVGTATIETAPPGDYLGVMDLVVIPGGVGLAVNAITALVSRLISKLRDRPGQPELEIIEMTTVNGDQVVVVRLRRISN